MYAFTEYKRTGSFPNPSGVLPISTEELSKNINENLMKEVQEAEKLLQTNVNVSDNLTVGSTSMSSLIKDGTAKSLNSNSHFNSFFEDLYSILNDSVINNLLNFFKPVEVAGHLDSLLGVQLVLYISIFIMAISVSLLLILHLLVNIFILNKDRITKQISNKLVLFYIRYQTILGYMSLYILPGLMLFGLLSISLASYHLITHPIPYENLDIDLHQYINSTKSSIFSPLSIYFITNIPCLNSRSRRTYSTGTDTNKFKYLYIALNDFTLENLKTFILDNFKYHSRYSILIKLCSLEEGIYKMTGRQVGFEVSEQD